MRPYRFTRPPTHVFGLFAAARVQPVRGRVRAGLVTFDLWDELRPEVTGVVLFTPRYQWVGNGYSIIEQSRRSS